MLLLCLLLVACDNVPTEETTNTENTSRVLSYTGPSCGDGTLDPLVKADICTFKVEFWNKMIPTQCVNCHNTQGTTTQTPFFVDTSDVNIAYAQALTIVNLDALRPATADPTAAQEIVDKINSGHNCGNADNCTQLANNVLRYITNWANGGETLTTSDTNAIVLTPPVIRDTGSSRSFPLTGTTVGTNGSSFENTIWPLLNTNCAGCHQESSPTAQSPFIAEDEPEDAYNAVISSQKMNLDDPAVSRLVVRLDPEFHNCWATPTGADPTGCTTSGQLMLDAITTFASGIPLTEVNSDWVTSKALDLTDGILASGGARDDSSTIALYEMKTGSGGTIYDTSGVEPELNLTLEGNEDIDYRWVGGWGIEFINNQSGWARGSAQNTKLRDHIVSSGEYSIEAWIVPANVTQGGDDPARIISYSDSVSTRNFSLSQLEYRYEYLNRNENSNANGELAFITDDADEDLQASQQHVVATYDPAAGRKIYVNGVDVSTTGNADIDPVAPGGLSDWDDNFGFLLGSGAGGLNPWAGKLRLVAIHNRALTPAQVTRNFDAGVGEKFYLMFSVSDLIETPPDLDVVPPVDTDCFLASARTTGNPRGDQCFIYMEVSQFDSYSYLFYKPTFISKNVAFVPDSTIIRGMRIGLNGKEPAVGQSFANLGKTAALTIDANPSPDGYCMGRRDEDAGTGCGVTTDGEQILSEIGTIIALEKGAGADEFFLSFEQFGSNDDNDSHADAEYVCDVTDMPSCISTPADGTPVSDIGLRTFNDINATMAQLTGVNPNLPQFESVKDTYYKEDPVTGIVSGIKQQLPAVEAIDGFVSAHQMAIAELSIKYCEALVDDNTLRDNFFGAGFGFGDNVATAFATDTDKQQIVDALYNKMMGYPDAGSLPVAGVTLTNMPTLTQVRAELIGPDPVVTGHPGNLFDRLFATCEADDDCDQDAVRTRAITKAMCASVLGSASMLIQ